MNSGDETLLGGGDQGWEELKPGTVLDHYRIERLLGQGGMGSVYLAEHQRLGQKYALKVLPVELSGDDRFRARFLEEGRRMAALQHPHIVAVHYAGEAEGRHYIAMEYLSGGDLEGGGRSAVGGGRSTVGGGRSTVGAGRSTVGGGRSTVGGGRSTVGGGRSAVGAGEMSVEELREYLRQLLDALAYAHAEGVVHRDLKPANLLVTADGRLKVTDFGLAQVLGTDYMESLVEKSVQASNLGDARTVAGDPDATGAASYAGTIDFMAPEVRGGQSFDTRSDLYAVGVIAYYLLTGRKPMGRYKKASELVAGLDPAWDGFIDGLLEPDPEERVATAGAALEALPGAPTASSGSAAIPGAELPRRRIRWWLPAAAVGAFAVAVVGAIWMWQPVEPDPPIGQVEKQTEGLEAVPADPAATDEEAADDPRTDSPAATDDAPADDSAIPPEVADSSVGEPESGTVDGEQTESVEPDDPPAEGELGGDALAADEGLAETDESGELEAGQVPVEDAFRGEDFFLNLGSEVELEMIWIDLGSFLMGSPPDETGRSSDEGPQVASQLQSGFWLSRTPVTQRQWEAVTGRSIADQQARAGAGNALRGEGVDHPVYYVSWSEAMAFTEQLTEREREAGALPEGFAYALPSETQWEYAARAGTSTRWSFGDDAPSLSAHAWFRENSGNQTRPVASKAANPWGLYDLYGNVQEWTRSWFGTYPDGPVSDYEGAESGSFRVARGGSWYATVAETRSASRSGFAPTLRSGDLGFRLALTRFP